MDHTSKRTSKVSPVQIDGETPSLPVAASSSPTPATFTEKLLRVPVLGPLYAFSFTSHSAGLLSLCHPRLAASLTRASFTKWYVLALVTALQLVGGIQWTTFGPISNTAEKVFEWEDIVIMILGGVCTVPMIILAIPASWFVENVGTLLKFSYCISFSYCKTVIIKPVIVLFIL